MLEAIAFLGAAIVFVPLAKRFGIAHSVGVSACRIITWPILRPNPIDNLWGFITFLEFGVVLLLFVIGLELQLLSGLWALRQSIFVLGSLQVVATGSLVDACGMVFLGYSHVDQLQIGYGLAPSSILHYFSCFLTENQQLVITHCRQAFTILLFQDIAVILLAILPFLSGVQQQNYDWIYFAKIIS